MLLGVGVLSVVGYMLYKQSQKPKSFANIIAAPDDDDDELGGPQGNVNLVTECRNNKGTGNSRRITGVGLFGSRKVYQCCGNRKNYAFQKPDLNCQGMES